MNLAFFCYEYVNIAVDKCCNLCDQAAHKSNGLGRNNRLLCVNMNTH